MEVKNKKIEGAAAFVGTLLTISQYIFHQSLLSYYSI